MPRCPADGERLFPMPSFHLRGKGEACHYGERREVIGPLLFGLKHPINVVSYNADVREIVNMAPLSCYQAGR
jgi:hypothetical protein